MRDMGFLRIVDDYNSYVEVFTDSGRFYIKKNKVTHMVLHEVDESLEIHLPGEQLLLKAKRIRLEKLRDLILA